MKFSVLMSVYNKELPERLQEALDSMRNQTLQPHQIVIVQDGPLNQNLLAVIAAFQRVFKQTTVVELKRNHGLGYALNAGLRACRYELIARMDSDDISLPDRFEKQISYMESHPDISVIGSFITEYDEEMKNVLSVRKVPVEANEFSSYIKKRSPFNHPSVVFKKSDIVKAGGYQTCMFFEDYYLWCRLASEGATFHNIPESLMKIRSGESLFGRRGGFSYAMNIFNFQKKIYKLGIIDAPTFLVNFLQRSVIAVIPNQARAIVYKKFLRSDTV